MPATAPKPKVHLVTFGCQMNKYDSELLAGRLSKKGYTPTAVPDDADVVALNTCSVRGGAEDRVYGRLGELKRLKRKNPNLVIAVLGCQAQREGAELLRRVPHVDLVVGTREFPRLPELVDRVRAGERPILAIDENIDVRVERNERTERSPSAYVAVMRGCDLNCTFCVVPKTRGRVRSRDVADVVDEVRWLVADGVREVILLGQTVNSYGYDLASPTEAEAMGYRRVLAEGGSPVPQYQYSAEHQDSTVSLDAPTIPRLAELLRRLGGLPGLDRIRLVTNHVAYLDDALIAALAEVETCMPFLPIPAQHGSDRVLREMRRGYTTDLYRRRIEKLRSRIPGIELSSDWIVGFPGETDEDFEKSCAFLREMQFAQNFIFKYSPRPETAAFERSLVPEELVSARHARLSQIADEVQRARWGRYVGAVRPVLTERAAETPGHSIGRTPENLEVVFPTSAAPGEIVDVRVERASAHGARGVPV
jgi:tRNA-2-methylthio-N6-dimethylallyladenosine synthase